MARKKNTAFVGCEASAMDIDAPTYKSVLENAVGDTAKIYDMVTGNNSEATVMHNRGDTGRGAVLGMPIVMQAITAELTFSGMSNGAGDGLGGETLIYLVPCWLATKNDTVYRAVVKADLGSAAPQITNRLFGVLYDEDMTELHEVEMTLDVYGNNMRQWFCNLEPDANPGNFFFGIKLAGPDTRDTLVHPNGGMHLYSVSLKPYRTTNGAETATRNVDNLIRVDIPSSSQEMVHTNIDTNHFADLKPFDAYALSRVNQNQNALYEYLTGWPAGSDAAYTLFNADSGNVATETAIAKHRFKQFARTLCASEGLPQMQLASWGMGAVKTNNQLVIDKVNPIAYGMLDWYAPFPKTKAAPGQIVFFTQPIMLPDFYSDSNNYYKVRVVVFSFSVPTGWVLASSINGAAYGTTTTFTQCGATQFWIAETKVPSTASRDSHSTLGLRISKSAGHTVGYDIFIMGVGLSYVSP